MFGIGSARTVGFDLDRSTLAFLSFFVNVSMGCKKAGHRSLAFLDQLHVCTPARFTQTVRILCMRVSVATMVRHGCPRFVVDRCPSISIRPVVFAICRGLSSEAVVHLAGQALATRAVAFPRIGHKEHS